jgi:putative toxin-antitoxin system antitoxin component (TIGR02293 family)
MVGKSFMPTVAKKAASSRVARSATMVVSSERLLPVNTYTSLLGLKPSALLARHDQMKRGIPFSSMEKLRGTLSLSPKEMAQALHLPERTLSRRKVEGHLQQDESNRLVRIASIFKKAVDLFEGDIQAAANWFKTPVLGLDGHIPLDLVETEAGALEVEALIERLEYGVFS